jgi:hypothetical protein
MLSKKEYVEYLLSTAFNYTCTNMADHKVSVSHDVVSDFLCQQRFTPADLWQIVHPHLEDSTTSVIIADDSVQISATLTSLNWLKSNTLAMSMACLKVLA